MKYLQNRNEISDDYFMMFTYNAGAMPTDYAGMIDGYSFTGNDGNIYEIETGE